MNQHDAAAVQAKDPIIFMVQLCSIDSTKYKPSCHQIICIVIIFDPICQHIIMNHNPIDGTQLGIHIHPTEMAPGNGLPNATAPPEAAGILLRHLRHLGEIEACGFRMDIPSSKQT
jgi:hypothetical protein